MNILIFSLGVMFKNAVQGGSQKVLRDISIGLAHKGHKITIICPKREDNHEIFELCSNVVVKPILPLRGAFPMPYAVSPFSLAETCRIIEAELKGADILYCHDGGLNIEFVKNRIPTVISLRDFCYPETLLGALNFREKAVVVNSMHTYLCLQDSFAQVNPTLKGKIKVIHNGYSPETFQRKSITSQFYKAYGLPKKTDELIIGFPHRPEMSKGFSNALQVLKQLTNIWGSRVKLLVPMYMDKGLSTRTDDTYDQLKSMIRDLRLQENVLYHTWVRHEEMPEYYSYCDVILCIGSFVEAFSNVSVEALLCDTPVVAANTSTYRTMPIRQFLRIVPYGAIEETARAVYEVLNGKDCEMLAEARRYISEELTIQKMVDAYERVFLSVLKENTTECDVGTAGEQMLRLSLEESYKLAAWCEASGGKIYDDYRSAYFEDPFSGAFCKPNVVYTRRDLIRLGIGEADIDRAVADGLLILYR